MQQDNWVTFQDAAVAAIETCARRYGKWTDEITSLHLREAHPVLAGGSEGPRSGEHQTEGGPREGKT